jgi:hypothetical protein
MTRMNALRTTLLGIFSFFTIFFQTNTANAQGGYVDFEVFYNELTPYGNWYNDPEFGYVWQPRNNRNFQPYYTNGYWVMTEYGNTWVSNYSWGWAPFHYGRWTMTRIGWVWIPGNEWGPAWVDWRYGNGYYGWAPMGPRISLSINFNSWNTPMDWFVFVPQAHIYNKFYSRYSRPANFNQIYNNTIIVNNYYNGSNNRPLYNYGPRRDDIARATNRNIPVYRVADAPTRSAKVSTRSNEIQMYRPTVRNTGNSAPRTVGNINDNTSRNTNGTTTRTSNNSTNSRNITNSNTNATTSRTVNSGNNTSQRKIDNNTSSTSRSVNSTSNTTRQNISNSNSNTRQNANTNTNATRNINTTSKNTTTPSASSSRNTTSRSNINTSSSNTSSSRNVNTAPRNMSPSTSSSNSSRSSSTSSSSSRSSSRTDNNSGNSRTTR